MKKLAKLLSLFLVLVLFNNGIKTAPKQTKPNILFIAIDDLKPILGCYGNTLIKTPNIDRLAKMGVVFKNNYCQQAVCGPTRASLMTGKRPDYTQIWDLKTRMRGINPDIVSIPQYFISQGYSTQGIGKVYDPRCVDKDNDKPSWSVPYHKTNKKYYGQYNEPLFGRYQLRETRALGEKYLKEAVDKGMNKADANDLAQSKIKPTTENADVPDYAYNDGANVLQAKDILGQLSKKSEPFFFAVGIAKPHLPFVAPKKYWDLYKREDMPIAPFQQKAKNAVEVAYHNAGEIRAYTDIPPLAVSTKQQDVGLTLPIDKQKELIHGYYAAVSYADAQVGILLNTLDSLGLTNNTIIVLWGDHGWHLGDHNLWCKHSNFEEAAHAPLIISTPSVSPSKTSALTEFVDIFPTLCELTGVPIPTYLDGKSLVPLMNNPKASVKEYSVSQYPRSGMDSETERQGYAPAKVMGYSIRTERYRYTVWMKDFKSTQPFKQDLLVASELYDYEKDPNETVNVAKEQAYSGVSKDMHEKMLAYFNAQLKGVLRYEKDIKAFETLDKTETYSPNAILFAGSSYIRLWTTIKQDLAPQVLIQRGFGGSNVQDMSYFVRRIVAPHPKVKAIVFYTGSNDIIGSDKDKSPQAVLDTFKTILKIVRETHPTTPIYWIEISPNERRWAVWDKIQEANRLFKEYARQTPNLHVIEAASSLLNEKGEPNVSYFKDDKLHPNEAGYRVWAEPIKKALPK
jgi:iduronate 2-sulfatase